MTSVQELGISNAKYEALINNYYKCIKSLIVKLSDFQYSEPLVFYT